MKCIMATSVHDKTLELLTKKKNLNHRTVLNKLLKNIYDAHVNQLRGRVNTLKMVFPTYQISSVMVFPLSVLSKQELVSILLIYIRNV